MDSIFVYDHSFSKYKSRSNMPFLFVNCQDFSDIRKRWSKSILLSFPLFSFIFCFGELLAFVLLFDFDFTWNSELILIHIECVDFWTWWQRSVQVCQVLISIMLSGQTHRYDIEHSLFLWTGLPCWIWYQWAHLEFLSSWQVNVFLWASRRHTFWRPFHRCACEWWWLLTSYHLADGTNALLIIFLWCGHSAGSLLKLMGKDCLLTNLIKLLQMNFSSSLQHELLLWRY